jgi:hypothetical protein
MVMPLLFLALAFTDDPEKDEDDVKAETCEVARRRATAAAETDFILENQKLLIIWVNGELW